MDFKQIEAFVNVVRYKSFSKAADATFFTQPTISTHIRNLEKELGVKLLDRRSRTVEMTPQGAKFYKYAVEMINARAQAFESLNESTENLEGILEIQSSSIPAVTFIPGLLAGFRNKHEHIRFYVSVSDTQTVVDNISGRRGEIGFVGEDVSSGSIACTKVATDKSVLIAPLSYDIDSAVSLSDIIGLPFIWRETGSATRSTFEAAAISLGYEKDEFDVAAMVDDLDSIIRSVEEGLGVSVISEKIARSIEGRVRIAELKDFRDTRSFYMIHLKGLSLSPAAEAFLDYVRNTAG
ncbi:MAG: LysR family transcriptional regulator [Mogibacterium sp.]|nr:LysR family transcriptional regulator [Mogibacterium sp.]